VDAFSEEIEAALEESEDFKSQLQERLAQRGETVNYEVVEEEGPPHDRRFAVEARVNGRTLGRGGGRSKKESEQEAAREALAEMS
jgi:ribonuclease III